VLQAYLATVRSFNQGAQLRNYPGSPFIIQSLLRVQERDKLKVFELHPTDMRSLVGNIAQLEAGRQVAVLHEDGFEGIKKFLPPPSRRALVLCDPSYELKSDYAKVLDMAADSLKRFATGTYAVWYPIIPRPEAHDLPRRLKTMTTKAGKSWLHVELTVKSNKTSERGGLPASGERFDKEELTAAHRSFAFGSRVCVRSAATGRTVVVRINDRGPFAPGRVIDLSQAAAQELGMVGLGIKPVELWQLDEGEEECPETLVTARKAESLKKTQQAKAQTQTQTQARTQVQAKAPVRPRVQAKAPASRPNARTAVASRAAPAAKPMAKAAAPAAASATAVASAASSSR
jgi:rare lipoprotein A (peptidoglycan hydrolase)